MSSERHIIHWVDKLMSIDKESSGVPEIDPSRRTTKVNLWMIVLVGLFFAAGIATIVFLSRRHGAS